MINRNILQVDDILYSESLNCYPAENQAAKIFVKWLKDHPEYDPDDVDMRIDYYECEEDYYGNGGGYDQYVRIFKTREETQEEHEARIKREEDEAFNYFSNSVRRYVSDLIHELGIYPNMVSEEITAKTDEIVSAINADTRRCLNFNLIIKED